METGWVANAEGGVGRFTVMGKARVGLVSAVAPYRAPLVSGERTRCPFVESAGWE